MKEAEPRLAAEVQRWFAEAAKTDKAENRQFGASKRGDEMPEWMANKEKRLEKIRAAKAALEAEAKAAAEAQSRLEAGRRRRRRRRQGAARTQVHAGNGRAERQGATQLHRSRQPRDADQKRLHPGLQRTGRRRWRPSDHRGAHADQLAERSGAACAIARCHKSQSREKPGGSIGRCGLLLASQSSHAHPTPDRGLRRHRTAKARYQGGHDKEEAQIRHAHRQNEHKAQARRLSKPVSIAKTDRRACLRPDQAGKSLPPAVPAQHRQDTIRMGHGLHLPQPRKTPIRTLTRNLSRPTTASQLTSPDPNSITGRGSYWTRFTDHPVPSPPAVRC